MHFRDSRFNVLVNEAEGSSHNLLIDWLKPGLNLHLMQLRYQSHLHHVNKGIQWPRKIGMLNCIMSYLHTPPAPFSFPLEGPEDAHFPKALRNTWEGSPHILVKLSVPLFVDQAWLKETLPLRWTPSHSAIWKTLPWKDEDLFCRIRDHCMQMNTSS